MAERQDIDALLVSALYGELDAADRARLDAHLTSHPEDRATLDTLERTRAQVRRGMAEMPAIEPPQAIGALLLQAAAQAAPRRAVASDRDAGLWSRFVAWLLPIALRPSFAGAAALVLVAGTATALWVRDGRDGERVGHEPVLGAAPATEPPPEPAAERAMNEASVAQPAPPAGDAYAVDLADQQPAKTATATRPRPVDEDVKAKPKDKAVASDKLTRKSDVAGYQAAPGAAPALAMDAEDKNDEKSDRGLTDDTETSDSPKPPRRDVARGGVAAPTAAEPPLPADPAENEWARSAHGRLVKLVADGKCPEAGRVGADIKDRAPEYYAAHVASDRAVRSCKQYIEGQARKRAGKQYKSRSQTNTIDEADLAKPGL